MRNMFSKLFKVLLAIFLLEIVLFSSIAHYRKTYISSKTGFKLELEKLRQEKEKKALKDKFEKEKYMASGNNIYERIYNNKEIDITDLIRKLALEAFPENWKIEVKAEEFTSFILMIQVDTRMDEPKEEEILKYLIPVVKYSEPYLKNVAVYNKKHQCYLYFDEDTVAELAKNQALSEKTNNEARSQAKGFTRYDAIRIDFEDKSGHIFIPVVVSGEYGSYECFMMLDTGASMTMISLELAQKTGNEDLNKVSRGSFMTANGSILCPIVEREIVVGGFDRKSNVAVNHKDDINLLGIDFFESREYIIDKSSKCLYVWSK